MNEQISNILNENGTKISLTTSLIVVLCSENIVVFNYSTPMEINPWGFIIMLIPTNIPLYWPLNYN